MQECIWIGAGPRVKCWQMLMVEVVRWMHVTSCPSNLGHYLGDHFHISISFHNIMGGGSGACDMSFKFGGLSFALTSMISCLSKCDQGLHSFGVWSVEASFTWSQ